MVSYRSLDELSRAISACRLCAEEFAGTVSAHEPRPVVWFSAGAPLLICGQAPGLRVHESGRPFDDRSGDRLREWMGVSSEQFYDRQRVAILPMAFCFPGYDSKGADRRPPPRCARNWRAEVLDKLQPKLMLVIGGYAQRWHLGTKNVTETVKNWREAPDGIIPLPHPSWRNTGWIKKNPWFEAELIPELQRRIANTLGDLPS